MPESPRLSTPLWGQSAEDLPSVPQIHNNDLFIDVLRKFARYFVEEVEGPQTFEELRTVAHGRRLTPLIENLTKDVHHLDIVSALLVLKAHFSSLDTNDNKATNDSRGLACETVAWRFVTHLSEREIVEYLLHDLSRASAEYHDDESLVGSRDHGLVYNDSSHGEATRISESTDPAETDSRGNDYMSLSPQLSKCTPSEQEYLSSFEGMNALEIAVVSEAKKFLSQKPVQKTLNGIWNGVIVFWESMSVHSRKEAKYYNRRKADPYCRLRVPKYLKTFEVGFFASFLALYYAVLVERNSDTITATEILLYIWIAGFGYDEFGDFLDAGTILYAADFWSLWDIGIILVGAAFCVSRMIGLVKGNSRIVETSFDILSIEALFLVPRIFALLSLNRYVGTLIPCLKEMTKDFVKFAGLVIILYLGFLTTFTLLARNDFTPLEMSWILINVFFGSSYMGFQYNQDIAQKISPILSPPLMLIFVCLTNILLITILISLLSNSLTKVMDHASEEFCLTYSTFVLEASTSNRLTYFLPPLNLLALAFRPLRLCIPSEQLRSARIVLLKATHFPFVAAITMYERWQQLLANRSSARRFSVSSFGGPRAMTSSSIRPLGVEVGRTALFGASLSSAQPSTAAKPSPSVPRVSGSAKHRYAADRPSLSFDLQQPPASSSAVNDELRDLRAMVARLSAQVEQLTVATVQQQQRDPEIADEEV